MIFVCPGCGAEVNGSFVGFETRDRVLYDCGMWSDGFGDEAGCLTRQLAQRDARIAELEVDARAYVRQYEADEATITALRSDLAALGEVLAAAGEQFNTHSYRRDACTCPRCRAFRTLPPALVEKWGVA